MPVEGTLVRQERKAQPVCGPRMRRSYVRNALSHAGEGYAPSAEDVAFLAEDTNSTPDAVEEIIAGLTGA